MDETRQVPESISPFPNGGPPAGFKRHFLGRFGEKVIEYLGGREPFGKVGDDDVYLIVDAIEPGDSPYVEEIGIDFHVSKTPSSPHHVPHWGGPEPERVVSINLTPDMAPYFSEMRYSFTFSNEISFDENVREFLALIEDGAEVTSIAGRFAPRSVRENLDITHAKEPEKNLSVRADEDIRAGREQLWIHVGSLGSPTDTDNERIDADLARSYLDTHEDEGEPADKSAR